MKKAALISFLLPATASAEVMDKEPSLAFTLISVLAFASALYGAARFKPWLLVVLLPVVFGYLVGELGEVLDPSVRAAMLAEGGTAYVLAVFAAPLAAALALGIGFWQRRHRMMPPNHSLKADGADAPPP